MRKTTLFLAILVLMGAGLAFSWGFFAHKRINRLAVFSLPPEMIGFFKSNIQFITENAVNPDRRRYAVKGEAEKHFLDADVYGDSAVYILPRYWNQAVEKFGEEELRKHGIGPWNAYNTKNQLTEAFKKKDQKIQVLSKFQQIFYLLFQMQRLVRNLLLKFKKLNKIMLLRSLFH